MASYERVYGMYYLLLCVKRMKFMNLEIFCMCTYSQKYHKVVTSLGRNWEISFYLFHSSILNQAEGFLEHFFWNTFVAFVLVAIFCGTLPHALCCVLGIGSCFR